MRRIVIGLVVIALLVTGGLVWRAPAALPVDLVAVDATGVATPLGITSRVPAISEGGVDYSTTQLTLDKATAKAAAFTAGDLVESFLEISDRPLDGPLPIPIPNDVLPDITLDPTTPDPNDHLGKYQPAELGYKSPILVKAQYPPSADRAVPVSAEVPGGAARAYATEAPLAHAEANGGKTTVSGVLVIGAGSSSSQSELLGNGTVVTTAIAQAKDVTIGGLVNLASVTSTAVATVPASGSGTVQLKITVNGASVAGVPAQLTNDGLQVSDQVPMAPAQLAAFTAGLASLESLGISIRVFPDVVRSADASSADAGGAALSIRYNLTGRGLPVTPLGDAPYDEELLLARVKAKTVARHRSPGGLGDSALPPLDGVGLSNDFGDVGDFGGGDLGVAAAPPLSLGGSPVAPADDTLRLVRTRIAPESLRVRDFYRLIVLLAFIGAAVLLARRRTRLT